MPEMIILYFNDQCTDDYGLGTLHTIIMVRFGL